MHLFEKTSAATYVALRLHGGRLDLLCNVLTQARRK